MKYPTILLLFVLGITFLHRPVRSQDESEENPGGPTLSGQVFDDDDGDAVKDDDEPGAGGIIVELLDADANFVARVTTDENGVYRFAGLEPDTVYFLRFEFTVGFGVRSRGIQVAGAENVFTPVPVIRPDSRYSFVRLNLINPANFKGEEVSPFRP